MQGTQSGVPNSSKEISTVAGFCRTAVDRFRVHHVWESSQPDHQSDSIFHDCRSVS